MNYRTESIKLKNETRYIVRKYNGEIVNKCYHKEKRAAERQCSMLNAFFDDPESLVDILDEVLPSIVEKKTKQRTLTQNKAMHLYYDLVAIALNDGGFDVTSTVELLYGGPVDVPWTKAFVKDYLWKPLQLAMTGIESTTELNTKQISEIYRLVDKTLAENTGISVGFPDRFELGR